MSLFLNSGVLHRVAHDINASHISKVFSDDNFTLATTVSSRHLDYTTTAEHASGHGSRDSTNILQFVVWGIIGSLLAILGFLGNTLSIVVLHRRQMRSSTSYYLLSLAIYDNGILLGMIIYFCLPALAQYTPCLKDYESISSLTIPVGYPLSLTAQMGSIYTCVGFTVERFIAVCRPLHVANTCTRSRTLRAMVLIFLWSLVYNIPRFFHYHVHDVIDTSTPALPSPSFGQTAFTSFSPLAPACPHPSTSGAACATSTNYPPAFRDSVSAIGTVTTQVDLGLDTFGANVSHQTNATGIGSGRKRFRYKETEFGSDPTFQHLYLIYSQLFFMFLLPFIIILVMNVGLIRAVKNSKSMHQSMCASARKEHNLTVMLIAVIVVFLVCQFPTIVDNILVAVFGDVKLKANNAYMCFYILCTLMVEINAASNFLLYCFFGKKFRMMLLNILGLKRKKHHVAYRSTVCKSRTNGTRIYEMEVSVM